ncbi:hypothetical protein ACPV47_11795 [Vibrio jasicida]|uniref:hypothetical protein n=1 Tax=Vibrio jasicida TaxID=766224 RepID=UPI004067EB6F
MKKLALATLMTATLSSTAFAATGDQASATATFSGWVSGSVTPVGELIVTGAAGSIDPASFKAELEVSEDGTFAAKKAIVLESHVYDQATDVIGVLKDANWVVQQVRVAGDIPASAVTEINNSIKVQDVLSNTTLDASSAPIANAEVSGLSNSIHLKVLNETALTGGNLTPGANVSVGVDIVATEI